MSIAVAPAAATRLAEIALPIPVRRSFTYAVPAALAPLVRPGVRVRVPFGKGPGRRVGGVCVATRLAEEGDGNGGGPAPSLKAIERVLDSDEPSVPPPVLALARFVAEHYRCSLGEALAAALPPAIKRRLRGTGPLPPLPPGEGRGEGVSGAASVPVPVPVPGSTSPGTLTLTRGQQAALSRIEEALVASRFRVFLLHGVTGSGKTEVYLRAIERARALGRTALVLVPEIALTPQTVARFRARLGQAVGVLHSHQSDGERAREWRWARRGEVAVVIGPRSAVFAPLPGLGVVVVDEEHETSFKQDGATPRYQARDLAVLRAKLEGAVCILGSATPSLETFVYAREGRYELLTLDERAVPEARLPRVEIVDLSAEARDVKGFPLLSRRLERHLGEALGRGEQAILFLNRRGFSTFISCRRCGQVATCGRCAVALTYHKALGAALCHYCDLRAEPPRECAACLSPSLHYFGFGTERIEEEVSRRFPLAVVRRLDSDVVAEAGAGAEAELGRVLDEFASGKAQVLIGTQLVAKGLDFPNVTVVGVISADTALNMPDFRAAERTFQLLSQVAGRAGRGARGGVTHNQTCTPGHDAVRFAAEHASAAFLEAELEHRRLLRYPPFAKLAKVLVSAKDAAAARRFAEALAEHVRAAGEPGVLVLGPAPAPRAKVAGRSRFLILLKADDRPALRRALDALESEAAPRPPAAVRATVDVDPASMLCAGLAYGRSPAMRSRAIVSAANQSSSARPSTRPRRS